MARGRISSDHGSRIIEGKTGMARVLEIRRIREGPGNTAHGQMECTVDAEPDSRGGSDIET